MGEDGNKPRENGILIHQGDIVQADYPVRFQMVDELQVLKTHRSELVKSLHTLSERKLRDLIHEIHEASPRIVRHPFDRYAVSVTSPDPAEGLLSPVPVRFVSREEEPVFQRNPSYHAFYSPDRNTVFVEKGNFSPVKRIESWVCGVLEAGLAYEEDAIEHEVRHGLFRTIIRDFTPRITPINEAFARAQLGGLWVPDIVWGMKLEGYSQPEAKKMDRFYQLFRSAQAKGIDDYKVLEYMNRNRFWLENFSADVDEMAVESQVLEFLREPDPKAWIPSAKSKNDKLSEWRFNVWKMVHRMLLENNADPVTDWEKEILQEKSIREQWPADL